MRRLVADDPIKPPQEGKNSDPKNIQLEDNSSDTHNVNSNVTKDPKNIQSEGNTSHNKEYLPTKTDGSIA
jgi:hypothetical protein